MAVVTRLCLSVTLLLGIHFVVGEKYSDYLLSGETGKFIFKTSSEDEQLCHICPDDVYGQCGVGGINLACKEQNEINKTSTQYPWCNCGPIVGCNSLPEYDNGRYRCWPFGKVTGSVYQTCVPECVAGFILSKGNQLRCGENKQWNETVVPPICIQDTPKLVVTLPPIRNQSASIRLPPSSGVQPENGTDQHRDSDVLNPDLIVILAVVIACVVVFVIGLLLNKFKKRLCCCPRGRTYTGRGEPPESIVVVTSTDPSSHGSYEDIPEEKHSLLSVTTETRDVIEVKEKKENSESSGLGSAGSHLEDGYTIYPHLPSGPISLPRSWVSSPDMAVAEEQDQQHSIPKSGSRLSDSELCLQSAECLTDLNELHTLGSRRGPVGCDSLDTPAVSQAGQDDSEFLFTQQAVLCNSNGKHCEDQDSNQIQTNSAESPPVPPPVTSQASPVPLIGEGDLLQRGGHQQRETTDPYRTGGHHQHEASADLQRCDVPVIEPGECMTFCDFRNERNALEFFSSLDTILVADPCQTQNWLGVSCWILHQYNIEHLPECLTGLKMTMQNPPPGNAYFASVINNYFVKLGIKLGQVLYFYTQKYPHYKIKQVFQQHHPKCQYCEQFYDKV
ncbi:uncharacterized protein LOC132550208 isoform X2 [Ylistrum balloti]|uniref:uncharacterized protein LOC132550208 isoform X2 n=1 Tax=Ylistrum balloti TaxID=509963 RepID=UPI00290591CA|nr:uncharacterized protein LOC132550208 isoform X2 [Ylistrum balloti]